MQPTLSAEKQVVFQEMVWRLMGNLQDSRWSDMLDARSSLGRWVRERYFRLALDAADDPASLLVEAAQVSLFLRNVRSLDPERR